MSRPTAIRRGSKCSTYARPIAYAPCLVQLVGVDAAHVVRLEDGGREHAPMLWEPHARRRCRAGVTRILALLVLVAAIVAAPAAAKGVTGLRVCGSDGCADVDVPTAVHEFPGAAGQSSAPPPAGPFVEVEAEFDGGFVERLWYVPGAHAFALRAEAHAVHWSEESPQRIGADRGGGGAGAAVTGRARWRCSSATSGSSATSPATSPSSAPTPPVPHAPARTGSSRSRSRPTRRRRGR